MQGFIDPTTNIRKRPKVDKPQLALLHPSNLSGQETLLSRGNPRVDSFVEEGTSDAATCGLGGGPNTIEANGPLGNLPPHPVPLTRAITVDGRMTESPLSSTRDSQLPFVPKKDMSAFPLLDIVQHPLPGYTAPILLAFTPDDSLISYLFSTEGTLNRKLYVFDPVTRTSKLLVTPPGGGVEEGNISGAEKLRRERLRERGLGVTRYDWSKHGGTPRLLVPLPGGVRVRDWLGRPRGNNSGAEC